MENEEAVEVLQGTVRAHRQMLNMMKTPGGRFTEFGKSYIRAACASGQTHLEIARAMDVTRGAVSAYMRTVRD